VVGEQRVAGLVPAALRQLPVISRRSGAVRKRTKERQIVLLCLDDAINFGSESYKRVDT
jgi:hypothetical protein